ncbi:hypothetical protein HHI36_016921 [Cryptolaemus montrouzieri]|uniref:Uncharacterized protein n=1 Tax=Cryptolaemus montrouzieri TaxID=559131 RepID=A0ABD2NM43_9CUCU
MQRHYKRTLQQEETLGNMFSEEWERKLEKFTIEVAEGIHNGNKAIGKPVPTTETPRKSSYQKRRNEELFAETVKNQFEKMISKGENNSRKNGKNLEKRRR